MPTAPRRFDPSEASDEILMAGYAGGDEEAFEELFRRYETRAYVFFVRRTGSPERAQDLYQETFLRIHAARDRFDPRRPFAPWFFRIAQRLLVDDHRRAFRSREVQAGEREPESGLPSSEERVALGEEAARVLEGLSPEERYVLVSSKVVGIGYPEIAAHLGKTVDAVKKMASRATQRLRASASTGALAEAGVG